MQCEVLGSASMSRWRWSLISVFTNSLKGKIDVLLTITQRSDQRRDDAIGTVDYLGLIGYGSWSLIFRWNRAWFPQIGEDWSRLLRFTHSDREQSQWIHFRVHWSVGSVPYFFPKMELLKFFSSVFTGRMENTKCTRSRTFSLMNLRGKIGRKVIEFPHYLVQNYVLQVFKSSAIALLTRRTYNWREEGNCWKRHSMESWMLPLQRRSVDLWSFNFRLHFRWPRLFSQWDRTKSFAIQMSNSRVRYTARFLRFLYFCTSWSVQSIDKFKVNEYDPRDLATTFMRIGSPAWYGTRSQTTLVVNKGQYRRLLFPLRS